MKKLFLLLILFSFIICLSSCSKEMKTNFNGKYQFSECVYLNKLSSSNIEHQNELNQDKVYLEFSETKIVYHISENLQEVYDNIEFKVVYIRENIDAADNLGINDILDTFDTRYDLYSNGKYTELSIFTNKDIIFIAETRMIGEHSDVFVIWNIFKLTKDL